ncbi:hypothetical protein VB735_17570 [Halotia wernerae UHCC 0503]|nr:hypothetical protein [Halotia wernerae UHCC 0503]
MPTETLKRVFKSFSTGIIFFVANHLEKKRRSPINTNSHQSHLNNPNISPLIPTVPSFCQSFKSLALFID